MSFASIVVVVVVVAVVVVFAVAGGVCGGGDDDGDDTDNVEDSDRDGDCVGYGQCDDNMLVELSCSVSRCCKGWCLARVHSPAPAARFVCD